jgi:peptidoglycan-N-acetylglucosamine deacetylase
VKTGRRRVWALTVSVLVAALALAGATAAASAGPSGPLQIRWAWLGQQGQQLVWRVELAQAFSPNALAGDQRSLCLLIERVSSGAVWGEACLVGPAGRREEPRLLYMPVSSGSTGPAHAVTATVSMPDSSAFIASFLPAAVGLRYGTIRWQTISALRSSACASSVPASDCPQLYPAKPTVVKLHTPQLVGCVPSGPSLVYHGPSSQREIALTFDDGPWNDPPASAFLDVLEREHVPATFFEIGRQISTYDPGGVAERRMLADGDMIGDHSWSHPDVAALPPSEQRAQLLDASAAIKRATGGFTPCLWRPPYGDISPSLISLARSLGFLTIMWDVDPRDWALPGVGAIYSNVVDNAHNGAIVIQHFGGGPRYETVAALPHEIDTLKARGYQFVTVAQMLGLKLVYR